MILVHLVVGWVRNITLWYKRNWGVYPPKELVKKIAKLPTEERGKVFIKVT